MANGELGHTSMTYQHQILSFHSHESKTLRISRTFCASSGHFVKTVVQTGELLCAVRVAENNLMQGADGAVPLQQLAAAEIH